METKYEILHEEDGIKVYLDNGVMTVETPSGHIDHPIKRFGNEFSYEIPTRINTKVRRAVRLTYKRTRFVDKIQRRTTPIALGGMSRSLYRPFLEDSYHQDNFD